MTTFKDWLQAGAAALVILSALASVYVQSALRKRDREDFEGLRQDFDDLEDKVSDHGERLGRLEGPKR